MKKELISRITKQLKEYSLQVLLLPWIWAFGLFLFLTFFVFYGDTKPFVDIYKFLLTDETDLVSIFSVWLMTLIIFFLNYTISFFLRNKYEKLETLFFVLTMFFIFVLLIIFYPDLIEVIKGGETVKT